MSTSGIKTFGSDSSNHMKKIVIKDATSYGPWKAKITSILDAGDVREIVNGTEAEPYGFQEVADGVRTTPYRH